MSKSILIIGSTSFIGSNLALNLKKNGYLVHGITTNSNRKSIKKKRLLLLKKNRIKIFTRNLLNKESFLKIKKYQIVINAIGWTEDYNNLKFDINLTKKNYKVFYKNLENYFKLNSPELFIEIGSSAEYGKSNKKFSENSKCNPDSKYGILKNNNSNFLKKLSKKITFSIVVLRIFSIFGQLDKEDKLVELIKNKEKILINKPKLKQDFISINYLNNIVLKLLKKVKIRKFEIYNCSSGKGITPLNIINLLPIKKLNQKNININTNEDKSILAQKKLCIGNNKKILNNLKIKKININNEIKKYLSE